MVNLDVSPTVASILVGNSYKATLVTSGNATLTITGSLTLLGTKMEKARKSLILRAFR